MSACCSPHAGSSCYGLLLLSAAHLTRGPATHTRMALTMCWAGCELGEEWAVGQGVPGALLHDVIMGWERRTHVRWHHHHA